MSTKRLHNVEKTMPAGIPAGIEYGIVQLYRSSRMRMMSAMQWSSLDLTMTAPKSRTGSAQLAGAKGMADTESMGMSFWLSPTQ